LKAGAAAWQAYTSPNPQGLEKMVERDTQSLSFLQAALRAHLRRFPSTTNGLGAVETRALEVVQSGSQTFENLFHSFGETEPVYGLGDSQFWLALRRMTEVRQPLLRLKNGSGEGKLDSEIQPHAAFEITDVGQQVLQGDADFVELNGIDLWLGGVHLVDVAQWRWDYNSERIVPG
jgi:hypothetical protein